MAVEIPLNEFVCELSGESLQTQDFLLFNGRPVGRKAYLAMFKDRVDASTLERVNPGRRGNCILLEHYENSFLDLS